MKIKVTLKSIMFLVKKKKSTAKHTLKENPTHNYLQMYYMSTVFNTVKRQRSLMMP